MLSLESLVSNMLDWDPIKRPTMTQILESPVMKIIPDPNVKGLTVVDVPRLIEGKVPGLNRDKIISTITLISSWFRNQIPTIRIGVLFQAVDIFYRAAALVEDDDYNERDTVILAAVCIWISAKSVFYKLGVKELLDKINVTHSKLGVNTGELIDIEEHLISIFSGVLYRRFIYDAAVNPLQLKHAYDKILYEPEIYYEYNASLISMIPPTTPASKELLINQFFN